MEITFFFRIKKGLDRVEQQTGPMTMSPETQEKIQNINTKIQALLKQVLFIHQILRSGKIK
jgi:hypothetical protein